LYPSKIFLFLQHALKLIADPIFSPFPSTPECMDKRTASKVDIYSNEQKGLACITEHIPESELVKEYGGEGLSLNDVLQQTREPGSKRQVVERFCLHTKEATTCSFELATNEIATISVHTKSREGADFTVSKAKQEVAKCTVKPEDDNNQHQPYKKEIASELKGPGNFSVSAKSDHLGHHYFLTSITVYAAPGE